jgi:hypothetical protein
MPKKQYEKRASSDSSRFSASNTASILMHPLCIFLKTSLKAAGQAFLVVLLSGPCFAAALLSDTTPQSDLLAGCIDLRPTLEAWGLKPRSQGSRGTCSVFAVVGALEYAQAHQTGQGIPLSVEFLNWASNRAVGQMIDGGFISDLWKGFTRYGICPEKDLPYRDVFTLNLTPGEQAAELALEFLKSGFQLHWIKPWDLKTGLTEEQFIAIKQALNRKWPVCGGFRWPKTAKRWHDDILIIPPPEGVFDGHSVLIIGYRDDPNQPGGGLFLFCDSNFTGPGAYRFMTYHYARAYMNDAMWIDYKKDSGASCNETCEPNTGEAVPK